MFPNRRRSTHFTISVCGSRLEGLQPRKDTRRLQATGTAPGFQFGRVQIPLNIDAYTGVTLALANTASFAGFKGRLDSRGRATARLVVPAATGTVSPFDLHHACLVFDAQGLASNAVPLRLVQ